MSAAPPLAETVAAFDRRSATYDDSRMHHAVAARAAAAAQVQSGTTLLDVAGGTGLVARCCLRDLGDAGHAVVLDASLGMLAAARRADPRLGLLCADAQHLPLPDASVDSVTCVTALHLLPHRLTALHEAVRVCRSGGRVVFTTWAEQSWTVTNLLRPACAAEGVRVEDPNAGSTPKAARALGRAAGLVDVAVAPVHHDEPVGRRGGVWEAALGAAPATALRDAPAEVQVRVRDRFESALRDTAAIRHELLLVTGDAP